MKRFATLAAIAGVVLLLAVLPLAAACSSPAPSPAPAPAPAPTPAPAPAPAAAQPIKLKTLGWADMNRMELHGFSWFRDRIYSLSNGRLAVDYVGGPEAIPTSAAQFDALRKGVVDVNFNYCSDHEALVPEYHLIELWNPKPEGPTQAQYDFLQQAYQRVGVHWIGQIKYFAPWYIVTKKKVATPADMKNLRIAVSGALHQFVVEGIGASPIKIDQNEWYTGLDRGVMDGLIAQVEEWKTFGPLVKTVVLPSYKSMSNTSLFMNLNTWNKLPADLQDVVKKVMVSINKDGLYRDYGIVQLELKRWTDGGAEMVEVFKGADAVNYTSLYASQIQKNTQSKLTPEVYSKVVELAKQ